MEVHGNALKCGVQGNFSSVSVAGDEVGLVLKEGLGNVVNYLLVRSVVVVSTAIMATVSAASTPYTSVPMVVLA